MPTFRRMIFISIFAGLIAGAATSVVQATKLWPLIEAAEVFETADPSHGHHWSPDGTLRSVLTILFNILLGVGFALMLNATARLRGMVGGETMSIRAGLLWGLAGFAAFSLAPSLGLPPELPGMATTELGPRQAWWLSTALCTAGALALWAFRGGSWGIVAVMLAAVPHLAGAPSTAEHGPVPGELAAAFTAGSLAASAVFWAALGVASGWATEWFDRSSRLA